MASGGGVVMRTERARNGDNERDREDASCQVLSSVYVNFFVFCVRKTFLFYQMCGLINMINLS